MPRASNVYLVREAYSGAIVAAFTVKHECIAWFNKRPCWHYEIRRIPDGGSDPGTGLWSPGEVLCNGGKLP